jgi:hypothetical protein
VSIRVFARRSVTMADTNRGRPRTPGFDVDSIIRRRGGRPPTRSICWTLIRSASRSAPTGCAVG